MKRFLSVALGLCLLLPCVALSGCKEKAPDPQTVLVGFWISDTEKSWYEFHADGTCRYDGTVVDLSTTTWEYIKTVTGNGYTSYLYKLADDTGHEYAYSVTKNKFEGSYIKTSYKTYEEWSAATGKTVS